MNIRGFKSKSESLCEMMKEEKPDVVGIVETMLDSKEATQIDGYNIFRNDRNSEGGGVMLLIRDELRGLIVDRDVETHGESIWISLSNNRLKVRVGVVYNPQESRMSKDGLQKVYDAIDQQIQCAKAKHQRILLMGDMNCKVGDMVKGNKPEITVGGKMLKKMLKDNALSMVNSMEECQGIWTRQSGIEKSVIDYIIINDEDLDNIRKVIIDEEKLLAPFRLKRIAKNSFEKVYSDHNVIEVIINWVGHHERNSGTLPRKVMTDKSYQQFRQLMKDENVSQLWSRNGDVKETYRIWSERIVELKKMCERPAKTKIESKAIRQLRGIKRSIRKLYSDSNDQKKHLGERIKLMSEHIDREKKEQTARKVAKIAENLRGKDGGLNENMFWKFKRKTTCRKKETLNAMLNAKGELVEDEEGIKQVYENFYQQLLQTPPAVSEREKEAEREVNETFGTIEIIAKTQETMVIDKELVRKVIAKLKRRKAGDTQGWTNEIILEGGEEMVTSVTLMMNEINRQAVIPEEWEVMKIKSIHKKGTKKLMDNRRGLFLTNVVSKLYERVMDEMTRERVNISEYQCGGQKGKSTADNIIMFRAVIDENCRLNRKTYCYYADAYKCFDRLWLKDCLIDLWKAGMREREVMMIYKMNERARITIETPAGDTGEVKVQEIVRQGTVFGPKLCCVSTQSVNDIGHSILSLITPEAGIGAPVYVDDILGVGDVSTMEKVIDNTRKMEDRKKFKFSKKKSKYMVIKKGKDKKQEVQASINEGVVEETREYKYLGMWFTEDNNMYKHIKEVDCRIEYMVREIKNAGHANVVGAREAGVQRMLYEKVLIPTMTHNIELATNMSRREYQELEKVQSKALKLLYSMPQSTPYWGMLSELGLKPLEYEVHYKRLMLFHNIQNSSDKRIAKQVIEQQKKYKIPNCFYEEIMNSARILEIGPDVTNMKKSEWKKRVKACTKKKVEREMNARIMNMKKLRFLKAGDGLRKKQYTSECIMREVTEIMKLRLNMVKISYNMGKKEQCRMCNECEESTEHILKCESMKEQIGWKESDWLVETENVEDLKQMTTYVQKAIQILDNRSIRIETSDTEPAADLNEETKVICVNGETQQT